MSKAPLVTVKYILRQIDVTAVDCLEMKSSFRNRRYVT